MSPTAAVVGSASRAPQPSAGKSAVWRPPAAEEDLVGAPMVHLTSSPMWRGVEAELYAGHLLFLDGADYVTAQFRKSAAQKGNESGVPVADSLCHGMWHLGAVNDE